MDKTEVVESFLRETAAKVEAYLKQHLPGPTVHAQSLTESMEYSLMAGGKRIRPALAIAAFEVCGGEGKKIYLATSALEMFHTFSLIHDDLPCMDDDDFRRGKPTNHKVYGEATAVLAGDALCILAFQLLAQTQNPRCVEIMAEALGTNGMIAGQVADIEAEGKSVDLEWVRYIHQHKTAALIQASVVIGADLAGAEPKTLKALAAYGEKIGLAFQIVDDILDLEQTTEKLGKDAGSDQLNLKATYPAVIGVDASRKRAEELKNEAVGYLLDISFKTDILQDIAYFIVNRVH